MIQNFVAREQSGLESIAQTLRTLCMDTVLKSKSGHIGLPLGAAELVTLLYFGVMNHDPKNPLWVDRDRFVLSAGHGSALLYAALHLSGYDLSIDDLKSFRQFGSKTPGHPELGVTPGVECTTGPLGQGLAMAVGMALAEAHLAARFSHTPQPKTQEQIFNHRTFVLAGDGCLMEGVALEAISLAGHLKLNRLVVFYDDNRITIDGNTSITFTEDVPQRFSACGWNVFHTDGNDFMGLATALDEALAAADGPRGSTGPTVVVCRTVPGKGMARWEGLHKVHGNPFTAEDVAAAKTAWGIDPSESFSVPANVSSIAKQFIAKRIARHGQWQAAKASAIEGLEGQLKADFERRFESPPKESPTVDTAHGPEAFCFGADQMGPARGEGATRVFSGKALQTAFGSLPELIGGSADLAGSNNTTLEGTTFITPGSYGGHNIHFGVREHAMAAIANGLALHGGMRPYCATFAVFSDYMRPAIRLAALMRLPTIFVLTHDSYAVGEDGPTHQPVEHAAALRAIPGLRVLRPADGLETFAAWQTALASSDQPTALLLTRQNVTDLDVLLVEQGLPPRAYVDVMRSMALGAMILRSSQADQHTKARGEICRISLLASGSETADALRAATVLESKNGGWQSSTSTPVTLAVDVISVPNPVALAQNPQLLAALAPLSHKLVAVEAGVSQSFAAVIGRGGLFIGINRFGESAPAQVLKSHFGLTPQSIADQIANWLELKSSNKNEISSNLE